MASTASPATSAQSVTLPHLQIVDRLIEFGLVLSAWDYANQRYASLKSSSPLVSVTLARAEDVIQLMVTKVTPVVNKFDPHIHYLDALAVQGLASCLQTAESLKLVDTTLKVVDHAKERFEVTKTQAIESVFAFPSNVVPLVDSVLSTGEYLLEYLLPYEVKTEDSDDSVPQDLMSQDNGTDSHDLSTVIRLAIGHIQLYSHKVQKRVVHYTRQHWIPAVVNSVVDMKQCLACLIASATVAKSLTNGSS